MSHLAITSREARRNQVAPKAPPTRTQRLASRRRERGLPQCCLSEPRDMVHPGPDSSDGCLSGADRTAKGEHLLATAQTRCRVTGTTSRVPNSSRPNLCLRLVSRRTGLDAADGKFPPRNGLPKSCAEQVKAYRLQQVAAGTAVGGIGVLIRESPGAAR